MIGLYLGQTTVASSFGAAASVVIFMIWVYYAALILLFGAEITQAVAARRGAIVVPMENAEPAPGAGAGKGSTAQVLQSRRCHSKLKMSSPSGRSIPASWYSSQICAHGRPYMSGTLYSTTSPGDAGVARPSTG